MTYSGKVHQFVFQFFVHGTDVAQLQRALRSVPDGPEWTAVFTNLRRLLAEEQLLLFEALEEASASEREELLEEAPMLEMKGQLIWQELLRRSPDWEWRPSTFGSPGLSPDF